MPGVESQRLFQDFRRENREDHTPKLRETIKSQLEKNNHFVGNVLTELDSWLDLVEKMITLDHRSRISAHKALQHPFF